MARQPEGKIVDRILRFLNAHYPGYWKKIHGGPMQARGVPDIIGCHRGRWVSFEVKKDETEEATEIQKDNGQEILDAQGIWEVVWTLEQVKEHMERKFKK